MNVVKILKLLLLRTDINPYILVNTEYYEKRRQKRFERQFLKNGSTAARYTAPSS